MPWDVRTKTRQRQGFVVDYRSGPYGMTELCARCGVSRVTGYEWLRRCEELGWAGLKAPAPIASSGPHATREEVREAQVGFRRKHPDWGSRKVPRRLRSRNPDVHWPAASTVTELFRRAGLLEPRRRRRKPEPLGRPAAKATEPTELWAADVKGQFRMGAGEYSYPLTATDSFSRYLLGCRGLANVRSSGARAVLADQQRRLSRFRTEHNEESPHEAPGRETPASVSVGSPREFPGTLPQMEYPGHFEVLRVSRNRGVRWKKTSLNVSPALAGEFVGFEEVDDGVWSFTFGPLLLARFEERELRLYGAKPCESHPREMKREDPV